MFTHRISLFQLAKFSLCIFESNLRPSIFTLRRSFNYSKNFFYNVSEINGCRKLFSVSQKVLNSKSLGKYMSKSSDSKCWNCKQDLELSDFCCSVCKALQYPKETVNFFELLGVSQSYDINQEDLSRKFKNLQMKFHPDKFANKTKEEMEISEIYSRLLNKAYTTLKHPLSRGFYLLQMQKISRESNFALEKEFLTAIMEKNEELESINNPYLLKKFLHANSEIIEKEIVRIKNAFNSNRLEDAKIHLLKLNYYLNLENKIKEKQNSVGTKT